MYKVFKETMPLVLHDIPLFLSDEPNYIYLKVETEDDCRTMIESFWDADGLRGISLYSPNFDEFVINFKNNFLVVEAAGGIVFSPGGKLLVIRRSGFLDLPKGHLKKNESLADGAIREVKEECGITGLSVVDTEPLNTFHLYEKDGERILKKTWWFTMNTREEQKPVPQAEEGIEAAQWMTRKEVIGKLPEFYPSLADLLGGLFQ